MPKRNYQFEKRQKDLSKKAKQEEKRLRRLERANRPRSEELASDQPPLDPAPPE